MSNTAVNRRRWELLVAAALVLPAAARAETNLVANGSFEKLTGGTPAEWAAAGDQSVSQSLSVAEGKVGRHAAVLSCTRFARRSPSSHAMLAQVGKVALVKGRMYRLSCWARAEGIRSRHVRVAIPDTKTWQNCGLQVGLVVGRKWRRAECYFVASRTVGESSRLQFWFTETGTLWLDDVQIVPVDEMEVRFTDSIEPTDRKNLLPNGSFECGPSGWASLGKPTGWGNLSGLVGQVQEGGARHGRRCLRIELGRGKMPVTCFDYFRAVRVEQAAPLGANVGWLRLKRGRKYTLSAWMRADRPEVPAALLVRQCDAGKWPNDQRSALILSKQWQRHTLTLSARRDYAFVAVGPDLTGGKPQAATVWIDAVQLEPGERATAFEPRRAVEIGLATGRFGNVFFAPETAVLNVTVANDSPRKVSLRLDAVAEDLFDAAKPVGQLRLEVPTGSTRRPWRLDLDETGWYAVTVSWRLNGQVHRRRIRLAIIRRYEPSDSPFGINHAPPTDKLCRLLRHAGIVWARDWSWKWQHVQPRPGAFEPADADAQVDRVLRAGMKSLCLLPPFPSSDWASAAPASVGGKGYPGNRLRMAYAPTDPKLLAKFIERCVRHCKGRVDTWEFLNEPIYTTYSLPSANKGLAGAAYTVRDYVRLLKEATAAMKRADPSCRTIGGIGGGPDLLTDEFIAAGGLECVDCLNIHTYPDRALPEGYIEPLARLVGQMRARGRVLPIWLTEYSYYATDEPPWRPFVPHSGHWAANRLLRDERQCADYSVRFALVMLAGGVEKIFYHSGASGEVNRHPLECCLLRYAGVPRKVYAAQAALASVLGPQPRLAARLKPPSAEGRPVEGLYGYAFQCGRRGVVAAWADAELAGQDWKLRAGSAASLLDIVGRRIAGKEAALSSSPVYVLGEGAAADLARSCRFVRRPAGR
jgi:hypothetical protein